MNATAPVTAGQQRLWFLAQVDPGALDYHIPLAFRLRGPLDAAALQQAREVAIEDEALLNPSRWPSTP
jgi:hypothetical protein